MTQRLQKSTARHLDFAEGTSNFLRFLLDECLPPILRDQRWFYGPLSRLYANSIDLDFKVRAPTMSEGEFREEYARQPIRKNSDMTTATTAFMLANLVGESVLDVGAGTGLQSLACLEKGFSVTAVDVAQPILDAIDRRVSEAGYSINTQLANLEALPFEDNSFDTIICLHVLEHVRDLPQAISELKRVAAKRILVVVPCERYFRYTCNYHLNFFGGSEQLELAMKMPEAICTKISGSLCFAGTISN